MPSIIIEIFIVTYFSRLFHCTNKFQVKALKQEIRCTMSKPYKTNEIIA